MQMELKYGHGLKVIDIPTKAQVTVLQPQNGPLPVALENALTEALLSPLDGDPFSEQLRCKKPSSIVIAIPDETRPTPVKALLPILLEKIYRALPELEPQKVTIIVGGGLHPPPDRQALEQSLPPSVIPDCTLMAHAAHNDLMVDFGSTSRGTPVRVNKVVADADFSIVIGQIDPHQFVGFTGGSKGVVIGCGAPATIEHNHSLMFAQEAVVGHLEGNPVREDINEAGRMIGLDFTINVVLNADKEVVRLMAGAPDSVLKAGAGICAELYGVSIANRFDILIASCGGAPKDSVLYQAQKGLNLASSAVKKGGKILLLAACRKGIGDDVYFDYVCQFATPEAVLNDFKKLGFTMGAHKAYLFGRTLVDYDVAVFSDLDPSLMRQCHLRAAEPSNIIKEWVDNFDGRPQVAVAPYANTTYFY